MSHPKKQKIDNSIFDENATMLELDEETLNSGAVG
jgi:hypothetical protein